MLLTASSEFQPLSKCTTRGRSPQLDGQMREVRAVDAAAQTQHAVVVLSSTGASYLVDGAGERGRAASSSRHLDVRRACSYSYQWFEIPSASNVISGSVVSITVRTQI